MAAWCDGGADVGGAWSQCHGDRARDRFPLREEGGSLASLVHRSVPVCMGCASFHTGL